MIQTHTLPFMKRSPLFAALGLAVVVFATEARATLFMHISEASGGFSRMVFSGSATLVSGFQSPNSIWVSNDSFAGDPIVGTSFSQGILSGGGTVSSSTSGTYSVVDVYTQSTFGFAPRVGAGIHHAAGSVLSWSGDLVAATPFTNFAPGVYTTSTLMFGSLGSDQLVLTIGPVLPPASVPDAASMLVLVGAAMLGLVACTRKRAV